MPEKWLFRQSRKFSLITLFFDKVEKITNLFTFLKLIPEKYEFK